MPGTKGNPWLQVLLDDKSTSGMAMRNSEAAEASVRSVAFYLLDGHLFAMQATKKGLPAQDIYNEKTPLELQVSRFDEDWQGPSFARTSVRQTKEV